MREAADSQLSFLQVRCLNIHGTARGKILAPSYCYSSKLNLRVTSTFYHQLYCLSLPFLKQLPPGPGCKGWLSPSPEMDPCSEQNESGEAALVSA